MNQTWFLRFEILDPSIKTRLIRLSSRYFDQTFFFIYLFGKYEVLDEMLKYFSLSFSSWGK